MKKTLLSLSLFLLMTIGASAQKTYALVTAVSQYANSDMNLNYTTLDAKDFAKVMKQQGFELILLTSQYANNANITAKLDYIAQNAKPEDRVIFFFSGHGGPGVFCTYDDLFRYSDLVRLLTNSSAGEIFCFFDACHSGSVQASASGTYGWSEGTRISFLMSSRADEYSAEHAWVGHGYLAKAVIKGLRGKADANRDRSITLGELYKYVYNDVTRRTSGNGQAQHPQLIGSQSMFSSVITKW